MAERVNYQKNSALMKPMLALEQYIAAGSIEPALVHLVKMRASQINGCAFCLDMHSRDARKQGESEQRLYVLSAWREVSLFNDRERAALEWTEAVTNIANSPISDALYQRVRTQFSEQELLDLNMIVVAINAWNRWAIPFETPIEQA